MKRTVFLTMVLVAFSFLQSCNDTSIDPIQGEEPVDRAVVKERLERTAWVVVNESDNSPETAIGVVIRYFPNGTLWESSEGDETTWKLTQDGKSIIMGNYPESKTYTIAKATENELKIEVSANNQTYWIEMARHQNFSQTKYLLSRTSWQYVKDGVKPDTVYYTFSYHDILKTHRPGDTKLVSTPYSLKNNETIISFDPMINTYDHEITALTTNYLKMKDTNSGEEVTMWARW